MLYLFCKLYLVDTFEHKFSNVYSVCFLGKTRDNFIRDVKSSGKKLNNLFKFFNSVIENASKKIYEGVVKRWVEFMFIFVLIHVLAGCEYPF